MIEQAMNCAEWPNWLDALVERCADKYTVDWDMSTEQAVAYGILLALDGMQPHEIRQDAKELSEVSTAIGSVRWMDPPDGGSVSLAEQVGRMRERIEQLEQFVEFVRTAPVVSGVCCCGGNMDHPWDGHSPVDQWDHSLSLWLKELGI